MESSSEREQQERRTGPTVSREKWVNHAKAKLARGYVLIVGKNRRTANFYLRNRGYEMCGYDVAKQLIKEESVIEAGEHSLGTIYALKPSAEPVTTRKSTTPTPKKVDEVDALLTQLASDNLDDPSAPSAAL